MAEDIDGKLTTKVAASKYRLGKELPFIGHLLYQMPIHLQEETGENLAWTDGKNVFLNKAYALKVSEAELNFLLAHEAGHVALKSFLRRGYRDPMLWNMATDFVINDMLLTAGIPAEVLTAVTAGLDGTPFKICYDHKYHGMTAEAVYEDLIKNAQAYMVQVEGSGGSQPKSGKNGPCRSFDPDTGKEPPKGENGEPGDYKDLEGFVDVMIAQAAQRAEEELRRNPELRGRGAGCMLELVAPALSKQISWRTYLHKKIRTCGFTEVDPSRPSRRAIVMRSLGSKFWYPRLRGSKPGNVMMVLDTSGSVGTESLQVFLGEINNCLRGMPNTDIYLYCCDDELHNLGTFRGKLPDNVEVVGRGGTSFNEAFEEAENLLRARKQFSLLVYLTDGYAPFPDIDARKLPYQVLWCLDNYNATAAPFGTTLRIDPNL